MTTGRINQVTIARYRRPVAPVKSLEGARRRAAVGALGPPWRTSVSHCLFFRAPGRETRSPLEGLLQRSGSVASAPRRSLWICPRTVARGQQSTEPILRRWPLPFGFGQRLL